MQWEARGPGLAAELIRLVEPEIMAPQADVVLVQPVRGGFGSACLPYNSVVMEPLLTDSNPQLPEVLRLGWLLAQLQCDLGKFQGTLAGDRLARAVALAMVPAVLAAAEEVELGRCDEPTIKLALQTWSPVDGAERIDAVQHWIGGQRTSTRGRSGASHWAGWTRFWRRRNRTLTL